VLRGPMDVLALQISLLTFKIRRRETRVCEGDKGEDRRVYGRYPAQGDGAEGGGR